MLCCTTLMHVSLLSGMFAQSVCVSEQRQVTVRVCMRACVFFRGQTGSFFFSSDHSVLVSLLT